MDEWTSFITKQVSHPFCLFACMCVCDCVRDEVCAKNNTKLKSAQQQCCKTVQMGQRYVGAPVRASSFATITFLFVSRANRVQSYFFCRHFHSLYLPHPSVHHSRSLCLYHSLPSTPTHTHIHVTHCYHINGIVERIKREHSSFSLQYTKQPNVCFIFVYSSIWSAGPSERSFSHSQFPNTIHVVVLSLSHTHTVLLAKTITSVLNVAKN